MALETKVTGDMLRYTEAVSEWCPGYLELEGLAGSLVLLFVTMVT